MGFSKVTLAMPSPVYIDSKVVPESMVTPLVSRKQSFRGFSASSLSSLALGRNANGSKRNSTGLAKKGASFIMSSFRDQDATSTTDSISSKAPSLMTDDGSLTATTMSSRSPSPEPRFISRLDAAFQEYVATHSNKILRTVLLPILKQTTQTAATDSTTVSRTLLTRRVSSYEGRPIDESVLLEEADINILFKWWNHLLLLAVPCEETFSAIYAIAIHPSLRTAVFWNAHYELTLSTTLTLVSNVLSSAAFAKLIALGYVQHMPTFKILQNLFTDPTRVSSTEPWIKRAKHVEVLVETIKHIYELSPVLADGGVVEARLEEMVSKVINVPAYPNPKLSSLARLIGIPTGAFALRLEDCLRRIASKIGAFEFVPTFYLLDFLATLKLTQLDFWVDVLDRIIKTENHVLQIRVFSFLYHSWSTFSVSSKAVDLLIRPERWEYFFAHWSGIVRDHYMRLVAFRLCQVHAHDVRLLLMRSFETSLLETCQLRDCLPSNPIPNKRFVIRPVIAKITTYRPSLRLSKTTNARIETRQTSTNVHDSRSSEPTTNVVKKKLGFLRGLWSEDVRDEAHPKAMNSPVCTTESVDPNLSAQGDSTHIPRVENSSHQEHHGPVFRFVPEYVGKQWSLTDDSDAVRFLDCVMDAARDGRLPLHCYPLPAEHELCSSDNELASDISQELYIHPFIIRNGRKQLWTRSLSEWSILLDDADRFWRLPASRLTSCESSTRELNCPIMEVEFPRWFVQRSTQVTSDGFKDI